MARSRGEFYDGENQAKNFHIPLVYNFCTGLLRETKYTNSSHFINLLKELCVECMLNDKNAKELKNPDFVELHQRGDKLTKEQQDILLGRGLKGKNKMLFKPRNGNEYFFSNVMVKIQHVPNLFYDSSDVYSPETASFVVLISEKLTRKRSASKS